MFVPQSQIQFQFVTHSVSQSRLLFGLYLRDIDFQRTFYKNKENLSCSLKIFNYYSFCVKCHFLIIFLYARFSVRKLLAWFSTYISVCLIWSLLRSYRQFVSSFRYNQGHLYTEQCLYYRILTDQIFCFNWLSNVWYAQKKNIKLLFLKKMFSYQRFSWAGMVPGGWWDGCHSTLHWSLWKPIPNQS